MLAALAAVDPLPLAAVAVGYALMARSFDLRRLDDPVVVAFHFMAVFWLGGSAFAGWFPQSTQPTETARVLLYLGFGAYITGSLLAARMARGRRAGSYGVLCPPQPDVRRDLSAGLVTLVLGTSLLVAFYLSVGGPPFLMPGAENARVDAISGRGWLVIPAIALVLLGSVTSVAALAPARLRVVLPAFLITLWSGGVVLGVGSRSPLLILLIAIAWVFLIRARLPKLRYAAAGGLALLVLIGLLGQLRGAAPLSIEAILRRAAWTTYVNTANTSVLTDLVPSERAFMIGGGYLADLAVLLPGPQANVGAMLKDLAALEFDGGGITIGVIGESYLNFGLAGVLVVCLALGWLLAQVRCRLPMSDSPDHALSILLPLTFMGIVNSGLLPPMLYQTVPILLAYGVTKYARAVVSRAATNAGVPPSHPSSV